MSWTTIGCREETKVVLLAVIEEYDAYDCPDDFLRSVLDTERAENVADEGDFKTMQEVKA